MGFRYNNFGSELLDDDGSAATVTEENKTTTSWTFKRNITTDSATAMLTQTASSLLELHDDYEQVRFSIIKY